jgi:hypothetical protein
MLSLGAQVGLRLLRNTPSRYMRGLPIDVDGA